MELRLRRAAHALEPSFYQIVERYSPHVIAGLFFGHTHEGKDLEEIPYGVPDDNTDMI